MGHPSRSSEFPNDNVEISSGARWLTECLTGPVAVELPPGPHRERHTEAERRSAVHEPVTPPAFVLCFDEDIPYVEGPVDVTLGDAGPVVVVAPASASKAEAEQPPALRHLEATLAQILMARGASRAAALLPTLLRLAPLPRDGVPPELQACLQARGYLQDQLKYAEKFREVWGAWSAVLSGASQDLAACGATTLDTFAAQLLAALLTVPAARADDLRRDLRKAGIAAFGVLDVAA